MPDPGAWFREGSRYVHQHYSLIGRALLLEVGLALALVYGFDRLLGTIRRGGALHSASAWFWVFREKAPRGMMPVVTVVTDTGTEYAGTVAGYSPELEMADRELILSPPLSMKTAGTNELTPLPPEWRRLVIPAAAIKAMWVRYVSRADIFEQDAALKQQALATHRR